MQFQLNKNVIIVSILSLVTIIVLIIVYALPSINTIGVTPDSVYNDTNTNWTGTVTVTDVPYNLSWFSGPGTKQVLLAVSFNANTTDGFNYIDHSPSNHVITVKGTSKWRKTGIDGSGAWGNSNGGASSLNVSSTGSILFNQSFTVCAWVKPNLLPAGTANAWIIGKWDTNTLRSWALWINGSNIVFRTCRDGNNQVVTSATHLVMPPQDIWTHICAIYNKTDGVSNNVLYVNGTLVDTTDISGTNKVIFNSSIPITIGGSLASGSTSNAFNGTIDDVLLFNWSLSGEQIFELYSTNRFMGTETIAGETWTYNYVGGDDSTYSAVSTYNFDILSTAPVITNYRFNSTSGRNVSSDNLTAYFGFSDVDADNVYNTTFFKSATKYPLLIMDFNANTSVAVDHSRQGNNGTLNAVTWESIGPDGSGAYNILGLGNITVPNNFNITAFTASVWIKHGISTAADAVFDNAIWSDNFKNGSVLRYWASNTTLTWAVGCTASDKSVTTTVDYNTWTHITVVTTGYNHTLYKNGIAIDSDACTYQQASRNLLIGSGYTNSPADFNGSLDDFRIYNYNMTAKEVAMLYQQSNRLHSDATAVNDTWSAVTVVADGEDYSAYSGGNITILEDDITLPILFLSPINSTSIGQGAPISLYCNASDNIGLQNISLWHDFSGTYALNVTNVTSSTWGFINYTVTLNTAGTYHWGCTAWDGYNYNATINHTFYVNATAIAALNISLVTPTGNINVTQNTMFNVTVNVSCLNANCGAVNVTLDPWQDATMSYCKNITVLNIGSTTLVNFTALLNITYDSHMMTNYSDLRFYNAACNAAGNLIQTEIDTSKAGGVYIWAKIPSLTTAGAVISMYYGNATASPVWDPVGLWTMYGAVYHQNAVNTTDSTGNNLPGNATAATILLNSTVSVVGTSLSYPGGTVRNNLGAGASISLAGIYEYSVEMWVKAPNTAAAMYFAQSQGTCSWNTALGTYALDVAGNGIKHTYRQQLDATRRSVNSGVLMTDTWQYVVATYKSNAPANNSNIYINGTLKANISIAGMTRAGPVTTTQLGYGCDYGSFVGLIDEVRITKTALSSDWINQTYHNMVNPSSIISYGSEQVQTFTKSGIVSTIPATLPFYTNATDNPTSINLNAGQSQIVTFWVNATGSINSTHSFYLYANQTTNMTLSAITDTFNVTIIAASEGTATLVSFTVTMPAGSAVNNYTSAGYPGTVTAALYFNTTTGDSRWVHACIPAVSCQTNATAIYQVTNTGNVNISISFTLNQTMPNGIILSTDLSSSYPNYKNITNSANTTIINSLGINNASSVWLWASYSQLTTGVQDTQYSRKLYLLSNNTA